MSDFLHENERRQELFRQEYQNEAMAREPRQPCRWCRAERGHDPLPREIRDRIQHDDDIHLTEREQLIAYEMGQRFFIMAGKPGAVMTALEVVIAKLALQLHELQAQDAGGIS
jgi:hypothetical protein